MKKKQLFFLSVILFAITSTLYAVPANPNPITFTQPNGDTLTVRIKGDERIHWYESMDGYTLLFNQAGFLSYAHLDEEGNLQSSNFVATDIEKRNIVIHSFLNTIEKNLFYSDIQKQLMLKIWQIEDEFAVKSESRAVVGHYKILCALVQFPERSMIKPLSDFDELMNQLGYTANNTGSVRDYFKEASYNQFDLTVTLCGVYTAPNSQAYYAGSASGGGTLRARELARWLAQQVAEEPDIDFREYDSNNDNIVDGFHFIFAGRGQENGGGAGTIWSHKWEFSPAVIQNGKRISTYSCSPELRNSTAITTIGVICHEMAHAFGAADFYDTNYSTGGSYTGTGNWDLMANGSWNGTPSGSRPAHPNMYVKVQFGWVNPIVLNTPVTIENMPNSVESPVAYRINTTTDNEHFLLENRQQLSFDMNVPGNGLLIYRVHSNVGRYGINDTHPQRMYPVCAGATVAIPTSTSSSYGNINSARTPFPGSTNQTSFTDDTTPSMKSWAGNNTNKPITNITHTNRLISFDFMGGGDENTYTVIFNANGGTGSMNLQDFTLGEAQNLIPNSFTRTGYAFNGWNTLATGSGTSYEDQQNITVTANMMLFAQWDARAEYTITATATSGGTITPNGEVSVLEGTSQTFIIKASVGGSIIDVLVDDLSVSGSYGIEYEYVFENVTDNYTIHAIFDNVGIGVVWLNDNSSIQIIPNPANEVIELRITNHKLQVNQIEFYNVLGQLIMSVPFNGAVIDNIVTQRISITNLNKGVYLVKAGSNVAKLVVQ